MGIIKFFLELFFVLCNIFIFIDIIRFLKAKDKKRWLAEYWGPGKVRPLRIVLYVLLFIAIVAGGIWYIEHYGPSQTFLNITNIILFVVIIVVFWLAIATKKKNL